MRMRFFLTHCSAAMSLQHTLVYRFRSPGATNDSPPKFEVILNVSLARGLAFPPYVMLSLDPHVPEALWLWLGSDAVVLCLTACFIEQVLESFFGEVAMGRAV